MGDTINWGFFKRHFWGGLLRHQQAGVLQSALDSRPKRCIVVNDVNATRQFSLLRRDQR